VKPGFCEADFVVHCGSVNSGSCVHSFVITDVSSGWTECLPLVARQKDLVVEALDVVRKQMPIKLLGINTDNDGAFLNEVLIKHCRKRKIAFTRSRAYRKNDQAWIEQKNGSVVRRLVGYSRFTGLVATHTLGRLYQLNRLYVNYFQPSFKLRTKIRHGVKVTKTYYKPATP
jgi:Integrase core domain